MSFSELVPANFPIRFFDFMHGHVDGNLKNDWITDQDAQRDICTMIDDAIAYLETLL